MNLKNNILFLDISLKKTGYCILYHKRGMKRPILHISTIENNLVTDVQEKVVISDEATVGIYNFAKGLDFVKYAKQMIDKEIRVNGEYYVAPVYNEMIKDGKKITSYNIGSENNGMYGLGIPDDLNKFLKNPISKKDF